MADSPNAEQLQTEPSTDSFQNLLAAVAWPDLPDAVKQEGALGSPQAKGRAAAARESASDTEQRRDSVPELTAAAAAAAPQSTEPELGSGSASAHGADSGPQQSSEQPQGRGRGRGRQRKPRRDGQHETAQQRAHRRFYERKKAKMASLEEEAAGKLAEYQRLLAENTALKRKHDALQRMIAGRDEHMSLMSGMGSLAISSTGGAAAAAAAAPSAGEHQQTLSGSPAELVLPGVPADPAAELPTAAGWPLYRRSISAPAARSDPGAAGVDEAGPFGAVQLAGVPELEPFWQQQQQLQLPFYGQPFQQQQLEAAGLSGINRSASMPARTSAELLLDTPSAAAAAAAAAAASAASQGMHYLAQQQQQQHMSRSFSSSPRTSRQLPAAVPSAAVAAAMFSPDALAAATPAAYTAGPSRLQEASGVYSPQQPLQQQSHARPHSWSGPTSPSMTEGLLQRCSNSFPSAAHSQAQLQQQLMPALHELEQQQQQQQGMQWQQQPQQPQQQQQRSFSLPQQQRLMFTHTITTGGPMPSQQQQRQQEHMQRAGSDPLAHASRQPLLQQQFWQQQQQQQQFQAPACMPQQQQQASVQSLPLPTMMPSLQQQQQFQLPTPLLLPPEGLSDEQMMIDDELIDLLEKTLSQQQQEGLARAGSEGMLLSPLPSIPSAGAEMAAAGQGQQQPQQAGVMLPQPAAAAPAAANLLLSSQQLQARHEAAGFFPPTGPGEHFYVHHLVAWYRSKLLQLNELLPRVDRPVPDVAAGVALVQQVEELVLGMRRFAARNRVGMWELKLINLETGLFVDAPRSHWRRVLDHVCLSAGVRDSSLACHSLYQQYVDKVRLERREVLADMAALEARLADAAAMAGGGAPGSLQFRPDGYEAYQELLARLQVSLQREDNMCNMLMYSLAQVVSHIQMAKSMVQSWPFLPDGNAIMALMHEDEAAAQAAAAGTGAAAWPSATGRNRSV